MIISCSRRTDIPAFYTEWLVNRIKEKFVLVRNPMNPNLISKIDLSPEVIDGIVFWTKNPSNLIPHLHNFAVYNYYFQFTLNSYDQSIEVHVPKKEIIIKSFQQLSKVIGKEKVIWRYDPILLIKDKIDIEYHLKYFEYLASKLADYTEQCVFSFIDMYSKTKHNLKNTENLPITTEQQMMLPEGFSTVARNYNFKLSTCAESIDLSKYNISHNKCIDSKKLNAKKDKNQRPECGCIESVDIGSYNTCLHHCVYCYANHNAKVVENNFKQHDPTSPLLFGSISSDDKIVERKMKSILR